jgi:hypothetical protein
VGFVSCIVSHPLVAPGKRSLHWRVQTLSGLFSSCQRRPQLNYCHDDLRTTGNDDRGKTVTKPSLLRLLGLLLSEKQIPQVVENLEIGDKPKEALETVGLRPRKDLEKRKVYKLVNKASDADFVFVVIIHDSAAEGLALAPAEFAAYQNKLNIEALREGAYARSTVGPLKIHNLSRISDQLVQKFHSEHARPPGPKP